MPARLLCRGQLQLLGGIGVNLRLDAAHFPFWSTQAYGMLTGGHEPMVQEALRRTLPVGGVLVDVGSNMGITTLHGARLVGAGGRVLAVDAQRECVDAVGAHARVNAFLQVRTHHAAITAQSGTTEIIVTADSLWTRVAGVGEHPGEIRRDRVPALTLDALVAAHGLSRVDVVKIDVEGAELDVLAGMTQTLRDLRPILVCEMHGRNREFVAALARHGYGAVNLDAPTSVVDGGPNSHCLATPVPVTT